MRVRCLSCDGVYETEQADGLTYHHVCPPHRGMRVVQEGIEVIIPYDPKTPVDLVLDDNVPVPRTVHRDERPALGRRAKDGSVPIVSEGLGIEEAPAPAIPVLGFPDQ